MITSTQAKQYLDQVLGITVPDFIVDAAVEKVEPAEAAMASAGYSDMDQILVQSMAVAIISAAGAPRRISSQGAPNGASRSFMNDAKALTALRRSLASLDSAGTVAKIVGPDPAGSTLFMVV